jgi:hypothetical protein
MNKQVSKDSAATPKPPPKPKISPSEISEEKEQSKLAQYKALLKDAVTETRERQEHIGDSPREFGLCLFECKKKLNLEADGAFKASANAGTGGYLLKVGISYATAMRYITYATHKVLSNPKFWRQIPPEVSVAVTLAAIDDDALIELLNKPDSRIKFDMSRADADKLVREYKNLPSPTQKDALAELVKGDLLDETSGMIFNFIVDGKLWRPQFGQLDGLQQSEVLLVIKDREDHAIQTMESLPETVKPVCQGYLTGGKVRVRKLITKLNLLAKDQVLYDNWQKDVDDSYLKAVKAKKAEVNPTKPPEPNPAPEPEEKPQPTYRSEPEPELEHREPPEHTSVVLLNPDSTKLLSHTGESHHLELEDDHMTYEELAQDVAEAASISKLAAIRKRLLLSNNQARFDEFEAKLTALILEFSE